MALSTADIRKRVEELRPWFHNMELGGVQTAPEHFLGDYPTIKWRKFAPATPALSQADPAEEFRDVGGEHP